MCLNLLGILLLHQGLVLIMGIFCSGCFQRGQVTWPCRGKTWHGDACPVPKTAPDQENLRLLPRSHRQVLVQHGRSIPRKPANICGTFPSPPVIHLHRFCILNNNRKNEFSMVRADDCSPTKVCFPACLLLALIWTVPKPEAGSQEPESRIRWINLQTKACFWGCLRLWSSDSITESACLHILPLIKLISICSTCFSTSVLFCTIDFHISFESSG